jgi:hypothetical protein
MLISLKFFSMLLYKTMAETGCLKDGKFNILECNQFIKLGSSLDRHTDFMHGTADSIEDATGATISQANGAAGEAAADFAAGAAYTLVANAISTFAGDGSAATLVNLPPAVANTYCILHFTGDIDQAGAVTIQTNAATDVFAKQNIHAFHSDNGGADHAASFHGVRTAGSHKVPTSTELIYTAGATSTNFFWTNSEIHFYCNRNQRWHAKIYGVSEGVGSTGVFTVA